MPLRPRARKIILWSLVGSLVGFSVIALVLAIILRPGSLKRTAEEKLSERLGLNVTIGTLNVSLLPYPRLSGTDLVFRIPETDLPPFIEIPEFSADGGYFSLAAGHVSTVRLQGMRITVPPSDQRDGLPGNGDEDKEEGENETTTADENAGDEDADPREIVVDFLEANDAVLTVLRKSPEDDPLVFDIHGLVVRDLGFAREMPFDAELTNPVPEGLVRSTGRIGPWVKGQPTAFPIAGSYTFTRANLDTIKGIGGMLTSEGEYGGRLSEITVNGTTEAPDFNLDLGGKPVPLSTRFTAIVNGSNGTTMLERVEAKLFETNLVVSGLIENLPGPRGKEITLDVKVDDGRIEDILTLVAASEEPILAGDVHLTADVHLPPGERPVRDRLRLKGHFGLAQGSFSDNAVQAKLQELSRRSQGKDEDERMARVVTQLSGDFRMANGQIGLSNLRFRVPGATVALNGTYAAASKQLDFTGTLRMQAPVSKAVGGFKSIFLKPFDWIFRKDGAGAVVPIKIGGSADKPEMGVRLGSVFGGGK